MLISRFQLTARAVLITLSETASPQVSTHFEEVKMASERLRPTGDTERAQSIIETALVLPFFFLILFNAINFGYYFYVAVNLASAPRDAVEYSIQGFHTPSQLSLPPAGPTTNVMSVSSLGYANLTSGLKNATNSPVQVCSKILGTTGTGTSLKANCTAYGSSTTFPAIAADPEAPYFVLHRVDVKYTVQPLIPAQPFGIRLLPNLTLHRQVSMRAID